MKPNIQRKAGNGQTTVASIAAPGQSAQLRPEFLRLPKPGTLCPVSGLTRSYLNSLILPTEANGRRPPVKSVCLRQRGAKKGVRLISYEHLMAHLRAHLEPTLEDAPGETEDAQRAAASANAELEAALANLVSELK